MEILTTDGRLNLSGLYKVVAFMFILAGFVGSFILALSLYTSEKNIVREKDSRLLTCISIIEKHESEIADLEKGYRNIDRDFIQIRSERDKLKKENVRMEEEIVHLRERLKTLGVDVSAEIEEYLNETGGFIKLPDKVQ